MPAKRACVPDSLTGKLSGQFINLGMNFPVVLTVSGHPLLRDVSFDLHDLSVSYALPVVFGGVQPYQGPFASSVVSTTTCVFYILFLSLQVPYCSSLLPPAFALGETYSRNPREYLVLSAILCRRHAVGNSLSKPEDYGKLRRRSLWWTRRSPLIGLWNDHLLHVDGFASIKGRVSPGGQLLRTRFVTVVNLLKLEAGKQMIQRTVLRVEVR